MPRAHRYHKITMAQDDAEPCQVNGCGGRRWGMILHRLTIDDQWVPACETCFLAFAEIKDPAA